MVSPQGRKNLTSLRKDVHARAASLRALEDELREAREKLASLARDISEHKRVAAAIENAAQEWRAAVDGITEGILVLDDERRVLRCNRAMSEFLGMRFSQILGRLCCDVVCGSREDRKECIAETSLRTRQREAALLPVRGRWLGVTAYPLFGQDRSVTGMVYIMSDITEKKAAEEALRETTQTLQALVEASPVAINVLDRGGNVKMWNSAAEVIYGWKAEEVVGRPDPTIPEDKRGESQMLIHEILQGRVFTNLELQRRRRDGSLIDVSLSTAPLFDSNHNIVASVAVTADITERKKAEIALRASEAKIRELANALIQAQERERHWVADEVHDRIIQNLVAVHQQLQALESWTRGEPATQKAASRALDLQKRAIHETRNIMKDLYSPVLDEYGLVTVIEEELRQFRHETGARTAFEADYPVRSPKHVEGNLYRVFHEALVNVKKHCPAAKKVTVSLYSEDGKFFLVVKDDGPGFDVEAQVQNKRLGGLASMKRRVEIAGGNLEVRSRRGRGTTVNAWVPAQDFQAGAKTD